MKPGSQGRPTGTGNTIQGTVQPFDDNQTSDSRIYNEEDLDDIQRFEMLLDKLMRENKLDKNMLYQRLKVTAGGEGVGAGRNRHILEEGEEGQMQDMLLDEHILGDDSIEDE